MNGYAWHWISDTEFRLWPYFSACVQVSHLLISLGLRVATIDVEPDGWQLVTVVPIMRQTLVA